MYKSILVFLVAVVAIIATPTTVEACGETGCNKQYYELCELFGNVDFERLEINHLSAVESINYSITVYMHECESVKMLLEHFYGDVSMASEFVFQVYAHVQTLWLSGYTDIQIDDFLSTYADIFPASLLCVLFGHMLPVTFTQVIACGRGTPIHCTVQIIATGYCTVCHRFQTERRIETWLTCFECW